MAGTPLAYLITFTTYGTWLHGDERGSIWCKEGVHLIKAEPRLQQYQQHLLTEPPFLLESQSRKIILQAILEVVKHRQWCMPAIHLRTNHIHFVIRAHCRPEKIMTDFKAYATRALRKEGFFRNKFWTHHGSTRYLFSDAKIKEAIHYVLHEQGQPMSVYAEPL
jgi:REP element-mobilizing transposase RayT